MAATNVFVTLVDLFVWCLSGNLCYDTRGCECCVRIILIPGTYVRSTVLYQLPDAAVAAVCGLKVGPSGSMVHVHSVGYLS